jgi:hypothetical protein
MKPEEAEGLTVYSLTAYGVIAGGGKTLKAK